MLITPAFAQASGSSPLGSTDMLIQFAPFVIIFVIMYFLILRPQQQRAKQQRKMLEALKAGDEVVTAAGLVATVITVKDNTVTLRSGDSKLEVTKGSITEITNGSPVKA